MSEEEYINRLCAGHYWDYIKYAFGEDADVALTIRRVAEQLKE